jgi:MFS family permease
MLIFTWGDRFVVLAVTAACAAVGASLGWLVAERIGAIVGVIALFPVAQGVLVKLLPKRYAQRSTPRT